MLCECCDNPHDPRNLIAILAAHANDEHDDTNAEQAPWSVRQYCPLCNPEQPVDAICDGYDEA